MAMSKLAASRRTTNFRPSGNAITLVKLPVPAGRTRCHVSPRDIKPEPKEPRNRLPLYPEIGFRHKFMEMIDAPTHARRYRVTERSVLVTSSGPYGHPAGATGVHARRTATLPEAVGRRQRGSAMFAAKPHEAEQELPEGIPEPRNVTRVIREWRCPVATGDQTSARLTDTPCRRRQVPWRSS
jgi:hypothetical protein